MKKAAYSRNTSRFAAPLFRSGHTDQYITVNKHAGHLRIRNVRKMNFERRNPPVKKFSPDWQSVVDELEEYEKKGCKLYLSGELSRPREIAAACVREENGLMWDFITDDASKIRSIDFIRIKGTK